jgi:hypothetical protein
MPLQNRVTSFGNLVASPSARPLADNAPQVPLQRAEGRAHTSARHETATA